MTKKPNSSSCALCESSNLASICSSCVNYKLNEHYSSLKSLKSVRESLYAKINNLLVVKRRADDQINWRVSNNEKINKLKEHLLSLKKQLSEEKAKVKEESNDLKLRYVLVESAFGTIGKSRTEVLEKLNNNLIYSHGLAHMSITSELLHKQLVVVKQICKLFPLRHVNIDGQKDGSSGSYDQICNARLPRGLDPHSVPSEELSASLGYMIQLLNLVVQTLAAPALHISGFAGSCSRIWQRDSYWDAHPSSASKEYPLFIPRSSGENSWSDRSSSNFGVSSVESEKKPNLADSRSGSFSYISASQHSTEVHEDVQKGISLLKRSVGCITTYCFNSLCLDVPSEATTFEAFAKILTSLSSSRQMQSTRSSLKMAGSRSDKQGPQLKTSVWNVNLAVSSSTLVESAHSTIAPAADNLSKSVDSFLCSDDMTQLRKSESLVEEWNIVEHPTLPRPSQAEDVEHWTRAMFLDARKA